MINQQLLDFIKLQLKNGLDKENISKQLLSSGWTSQDIEEGFKNLIPASSVPIPNYSSPLKKKSPWKVILVIVLILIILGGGTYYFLQNKNLHLSQISIDSTQVIKPIDDSALQISPMSVPDSENASVELVKLKGLLSRSNFLFNYLNFQNKNPDVQTIQQVKSIVLQGTNALQIFNQSIVKPKYYCDLNIKDNYCNFSDLLNISSLVIAQSDVLFREGKYKESMSEAFKVLDFGQKIENSSAQEATYIIALSVKKMALTEIQIISDSGKLSSLDKAVYKQKLTQYTDDITGMKNSLKYEYQNKIKTIDAITSGDLSFLELTFGGNVSRDSLDNESKKLFDILNEYQKNKNPKLWNPTETKALVYSGFKTALDYVDVVCGSVYPLPAFDISKLDPQGENYIGKLTFGIFSGNINESFVNRKCPSILLYEAINNSLN